MKYNTLQQLSIFLENKIGSLYEIMDILSNANIRIIAATVADTSEFGILRLITSDNDKAYSLLRSAQKSAQKSEVIAISCDSLAGAFYDELKKFACEGIVVEYMYCFSVGSRAIMVVRVNNLEVAMQLIEREGIKSLTNDDLAQI
ncbi:MAG: acetolactate synthase [Rikenellaceae bacterium]